MDLQARRTSTHQEAHSRRVAEHAEEEEEECYNEGKEKSGWDYVTSSVDVRVSCEQDEEASREH